MKKVFIWILNGLLFVFFVCATIIIFGSIGMSVGYSTTNKKDTETLNEKIDNLELKIDSIINFKNTHYELENKK